MPASSITSLARYEPRRQSSQVSSECFQRWISALLDLLEHAIHDTAKRIKTFKRYSVNRIGASLVDESEKARDETIGCKVNRAPPPSDQDKSGRDEQNRFVAGR